MLPTKREMMTLRSQITKLESAVTEAAWSGALPPLQAQAIEHDALQRRMQLEAHILKLINNIVKRSQSNG